MRESAAWRRCEALAMELRSLAADVLATDSAPCDALAEVAWRLLADNAGLASHCASRILGVALADGTYVAAHALPGDAGDVVVMSGTPDAWRMHTKVPVPGGDADVDAVTDHTDGDWDVRKRPWFAAAARAPHRAGWTTPYLEETSSKLVESFVAPLLVCSGGDEVFAGVVVCGSFAVATPAAKAPAAKAPAAKAPCERLSRPPQSAWVELTDPKMQSRVMYTNPVCLLTTWDLAGGQWVKNVMTISWLTAVNNDAEFVFSMNKRRHSAKAVCDDKRPFGLSVPVRGMEALVLAIGNCSGRRGCKFGAVPGLAAAEARVEGRKRPANGFAALADSSSDDSDGDAPAEPAPPVFYVEGTVARLSCVMVRELYYDDDHRVCVARIDSARVRGDYWRDSKLFAPIEDAPPYLTFLGSQKFGYVT
ncbi:hypothetical protein M885DRAFT_547013 [Pelagophyceae sp. CCMP2097]|nr:hypothetical protein M885DRAFT_547013 [Pelagophyceae sp. CCMP2097]